MKYRFGIHLSNSRVLFIRFNKMRSICLLQCLLFLNVFSRLTFKIKYFKRFEWKYIFLFLSAACSSINLYYQLEVDRVANDTNGESKTN